ncbi:MAG: MbcA/ParS/Xre antitoxin family protein [Cyclobacteriaceae bacterium]|nr:MbcA/ParS/Xre antitoxin family protein [Cyclobacteriaceae bacterium]
MEVNEALVQYVKKGDLESDDDWAVMTAVRSGLSFVWFSDVTDKTPFTAKDWARMLHISERTMLRYKKENGVFDPIHSERIVEIAMLCRYGEQVFGNPEKFKQWIGIHNIALGAKRPKDLLDTHIGISMVRDELVRIEHGVLA